MNYEFQLPGISSSNFELVTSMWTGKSKLWMDNLPVEQSKEKGKPFLIPTPDGAITKAFPKQPLNDFAPILEIDGVKNLIVEPLKWYQSIISGLPIALFFIGGGFGALIGLLSTFINFNIFRQMGNEPAKYLKVTGVIFGACFLYFVIAIFVLKVTK